MRFTTHRYFSDGPLPFLALACSVAIGLMSAACTEVGSSTATEQPLRLSLWEQEPASGEVASRALLAVVTGVANPGGAGQLTLEFVTLDGDLCPTSLDGGDIDAAPSTDGGLACAARVVYRLQAIEEEQSFVTIVVARESVQRPLVVGTVSDGERVLVSVPRRLGAEVPVDAGTSRNEDGGTDAGADAATGEADAGSRDDAGSDVPDGAATSDAA